MLTSDIDVIRNAVRKLLKRKDTPRQVVIRRNHAQYLGVKFWGNVSDGTPMELHGEEYVLVWVNLGELTVALKGAKGEDDEFVKHGIDPGRQEDSSQD